MMYTSALRTFSRIWIWTSPARHEPYYGGVSRFPSAHSAPLRGYTPKRRPPWEKEVRLGELQRL